MSTLATPPDTVVSSLRDSLELDHVESHLHPRPSYDLADHPKPTGREEIWRFTPLKRLQGLLDAEPAEAGFDVDAQVPDGGVTFRHLDVTEARALQGVAPFDRLGALAAAASAKVGLLEIPAEVELDAPIRIDSVGQGTGELAAGHTIIKVGAHAHAKLIFTDSGSARFNSLVQVLVGDGASLDMITVLDWADDTVHTQQTNITVGRDATVRHFEVTIGGDLVRTSTNVDYAGPGGSFEGYGLYFADAGQHIEHRLFVDHTAPRTKSHVSYKGALQGEKAHTVWVGNVLIRKVAEGIETYEENRNLILTDGAQADSVPNLEIETGEIEGAGHASATGRFDDEQLFYLRSRGISETEARRLVVHGFFNDLIRQIGVPELEAKLTETVEAELAKNLLADGGAA